MALNNLRQFNHFTDRETAKKVWGDYFAELKQFDLLEDARVILKDRKYGDSTALDLALTLLVEDARNPQIPQFVPFCKSRKQERISGNRVVAKKVISELPREPIFLTDSDYSGSGHNSVRALEGDSPSYWFGL